MIMVHDEDVQKIEALLRELVWGQLTQQQRELCHQLACRLFDAKHGYPEERSI